MRVRAAGWVLGRVLRRARLGDKPASAVLAATLMCAAPAYGIELQLPIDCVPGKTCFVQNYPDDGTLDGDGIDYACGGATYPGHDGTDIRMLSVESAKGVKVLAAAPGIVKGIRDGETDHLMRTPADRAAIAGKECGNGVVIDHADGWQTQYCHMHAGSVRVHTGDKVEAGAVLGEVGQSGETQFAHVHLSVRHNGEKFDPFLGSALKTACHADGKPGAAKPLWRADVMATLGPPSTVVLETGFTDQPVGEDALEEGHGQVAPFQGRSPVLAFYARVMHLLKGDRVHLQVSLPNGAPIDQTTEPMTHAKAVKVISVARKRGSGPWPAGRYAGHAEVLRAGAVVTSSDIVATLP